MNGGSKGKKQSPSPSLENHKVRGEVNAMQITSFCFAFINTEYQCLLHIHVQRHSP